MSFRNLQQEFEFDVPMGIDNTSPLTTMKAGYVREAVNVNPGLQGGYDKRKGFTEVLDTDYGTRAIVAGTDFKLSNGTTRRVIFGTDYTATGGRYGYVDSGAITDITTSLDGDARPSFVQFQDRLFMFNGVDSPEIYDGSGTRQVGITPPASAPSGTSSNSTGSLENSGKYIFAYTYYNSTTGAESSPSELFEITLGGSDDTVSLTIAAGSSSTADQIRIYRTVAFGNILFLEGTAAIGATSFTSEATDSFIASSQQMELDNTRITVYDTTPEFPIIADNRIFLKTGRNQTRFSKIGQEGPMPESFEVKSVIDSMSILGNANDIVGYGNINQLVICLKERSIGRFDPVGIPSLLGVYDNVTYEYREISTTVGAVSHEAAVQVFDELIFLSRDNIYATNGNTVRPIADSIQTNIRAYGYTASQIPRISCVNDTDNKRVYFALFSSELAADPDTLLVGDYAFYPNFRWTTYSGVEAGSLFSLINTDTGRLDAHFGGLEGTGQFYKMNTGDNDAGASIAMRIVSRPYFFGNPLNVKLLKEAEIQAQGSGGDYSVNFSSKYDLSSEEEDMVSLDVEATAFLYDDPSSLYDVATYAGDAFKSLSYNLHRKCKFYQLVIEQDGIDTPMSIFSWGISASGFGTYASQE